MRSTYVLGFAFLTTLAGLACSSEKKGPGVTNPYSTQEKFCERWAAAACNAKVADGCAGGNVEACTMSQQTFCLNQLPSNYAGDQKRAEACVAAVKKAYADAILTADEIRLVREFGEPCDKLYDGPGDVGATCSEDSDCNTLEDLECVKKGEEATEGTCQIPQVAAGGAPCDGLDTVCEDSHYCDANSGACLQRKTAGGACGPGAPCAQDLQCLGVTGNFTCQAKVAVGQQCNTSGECQSGLCAFGTGAPTGVCAAEVQLTTIAALCDDLN